MTLANVQKKRSALNPTDDFDYFSRSKQQRDRHVDQDSLVKEAGNEDNNPVGVLRKVQVQIAREAASLEYDKNEAILRGLDSTKYTVKRVECLKKIVDVELQIQQLNKLDTNVSLENMQAIFKIWIERLQVVASDVLTEEQSKMFFNRFSTAMEGWEQEAQSILEEKS